MGMGQDVNRITLRGVLCGITASAAVFCSSVVIFSVSSRTCSPPPLEARATRELAPPDADLNATVERVVDGDTFVAVVDLGYDVMTRARIRLAGVDTPELKGGSEEERAKAVEARDFVAGRILGRRVMIRAMKKDSFGRYVSLVWYGEGRTNLSDELLRRGLAVKYVRD